MRRAVIFGGLLVLALILRNAVFVQLRVFDAVPELICLVVVAVALCEGPETAAVVGFVGGLLQDLSATFMPVGISALAFVLVGYGVGQAHSYVIRPGWFLAPAMAAAGVMAGLTVAILAGGIVGQEFMVSGYQLRVALWASVYSGLVFPGVLAVVRRVLVHSRLDRVAV